MVLAEALFAELLSSKAARVLLHGDPHHYNIVQASPARDGWPAIDPKGVVGEPAYEAEVLAALLNGQGWRH